MKQIILFFLVLLPVCVSAQFVETFDGPLLHSANPWTDDSGKYVINDGRLLFDGSGLTGSYSCYVPISYTATMEWEVDVSLSFKPSNFNQTRIYVYRTGQPDDLLFFIQIGSNDDNVSFYKWPPKGGPERLIAGKRRVGGNEIHIKLTMEDHCFWTLYTKLSGENHYIAEGKVATKSLQGICNSGNLNIICYCKAKSYKDMFFNFDNLIVRDELTTTPLTPEENPENPERPQQPETLPELLSVQPLSSSELQFGFDLPVGIEQSEFAVSGIGKADRILYADETEKTVNTHFPGEMVLGQDYTISFQGVTDRSGYPLASFSQDVTFEREEDDIPLSGSVIINEIMADPKGLGNASEPNALKETEYVELHNTTDQTILLSGWQFAYAGKAKPMTSFELPSGGYAVLYRSGREITVASTGVKVPLDNFPAALANTGKLLQLLDAEGNLIDEVTYEKATPGKSWERSGSGWHLSSDPKGGTPGEVNSSGAVKPETPDEPSEPDDPNDPIIPEEPVEPDQFVEPRDFVFNELLPNPYTGGSEYIELYNRSGHALSVSGLSVATRKTDSSLSTHYTLSDIKSTIEPEGYVLLSKSKAGVSDFYTITDPSSLYEIPKLPILANTSSTLVLFRTSDELVIDEVSYSSKWHASSIKDQKGVALERIDPERETQSASNWTSASVTAGYGTPGYHNSQSMSTKPGESEPSTGIDIPKWQEDSDLYLISYLLDQPGYHCRALVFNVSGARVAEIANHELLGVSGRLTWDGMALTGKKLQTGIYIFYAEIYHANGQVKAYKKVFLVK